MPAARAAASISAPGVWSSLSPSGRLLMIRPMPCAAASATSARPIWGLAKTRSVKLAEHGGSLLAIAPAGAAGRARLPGFAKPHRVASATRLRQALAEMSQLQRSQSTLCESDSPLASEFGYAAQRRGEGCAKSHLPCRPVRFVRAAGRVLRGEAKVRSGLWVLIEGVAAGAATSGTVSAKKVSIHSAVAAVVAIASAAAAAVRRR